MFVVVFREEATGNLNGAGVEDKNNKNRKRNKIFLYTQVVSKHSTWEVLPTLSPLIFNLNLNV